MLDYLRRLFDYDAWANGEALHSLQATPSERSLKLMAHIIGAEWLWLARLQAKPALMPVWPDFTLDQCISYQQQLPSAWRDYLAAQTADTLLNTASYKNSKGEPWTNAVQDVLTHVVMHGAYHRGQIALDVRTNGGPPAYTDFIEAVRRGKLG